ncbi:MAG: glycosyltransferase [Planctomycetaceae bacterium]|jgi:rSAM/selenodomain-associated transferase 2|nr:glycosyltransferase [Planctomycetaceae bacterium]
MEVSILIPALNEARRIEDTVTAARLTGGREVIVCDGGSEDGTVEAAIGAGAVVVACPPGRAIQQNRAASASSGDVLLFLHADCRLPPDALEQVDRALRDSRVVGGAFRQRIDATGYAYRLLECGNAWRARWLQQPYGDQGLFVRRREFEAVGGFPKVALMEDLLLVQRLRRIGRLAVLPGPLVTDARRWQQHGVVRQTLRNWSLLLARRVGVSPERLARFYRRHDVERSVD